MNSKLIKQLESMSNPRQWFEVNLDSEIPEILIYDQIGMDFWGEGYTAQDFIDQLDDIKADEINIRINSPGGSVWDGQAIYSAMTRHPAKINTYNDGMAASIASVFFQGGDRRFVSEHARFMVHDPWSFVMGNARQMRKTAIQLDTAKQSLMSIYMAKVSIDEVKMDELMADETYINAEKAVEIGLADEIIPNQKNIAFAFDLGVLGGVPNELMELQIANDKRALESSLRDAGYSRSEAKNIAAGPRRDDVEQTELDAIIKILNDTNNFLRKG